jgi:hypothetical protein
VEAKGKREREMLSTKRSIEVYRIVIFLVVMYGCETLMIKQRLRVLDKMCSREYLKFRGIKWQKARENFIIRNSIICKSLLVLL